MVVFASIVIVSDPVLLSDWYSRADPTARTPLRIPRVDIGRHILLYLCPSRLLRQLLCQGKWSCVYMLFGLIYFSHPYPKYISL